MRKLIHIFINWLIVALVTSAFCCLVYAAVQHAGLGPDSPYCE
jgi:hypothetical protein